MFRLTISIIVNIKSCKLCQQEKSLDCFYLTNDHYSSRCKKCFGEYQKNNPNRKDNVKKYDCKNRDQKNKKSRERYYLDVDKTREIERLKAKRKRKSNPEHYRKYQNEWRKKNYERLKNTPNWKIRKTIRSRFLRAIKNEFKKTSCLDLLGCSISDLRIHLESQFKEGMTWDNHGVKGWHIDHIRPCASFDLSDPEQQRLCFHYSNIQPLWWNENLSKSDRII